MPSTAFTTSAETVNVWQLSLEIRKLGLPFKFIGMSVNLSTNSILIETDVGISPEEQVTIQAVIDAHIPRDVEQIALDAVDEFRGVPWHNMTLDQTLQDFDGRPMNVAQMSAVVRELLQTVVSLRNLVLPFLQGS